LELSEQTGRMMQPYTKKQLAKPNDPFSNILNWSRFVLLHSILYYLLAEAFISDAEFERTCDELMKWRDNFPREAKWNPYHDLVEGLDKSYSLETESCASMKKADLVAGAAYMMSQRNGIIFTEAVERINRKMGENFSVRGGSRS
jgi:hypothetical protein